MPKITVTTPKTHIVSLLRIAGNGYDCFECGCAAGIFDVGGLDNWQEISEQDYQSLSTFLANQNSYSSPRYIMVEKTSIESVKSEDLFKQLIEAARKREEDIVKQKEKYELAAKKRKEQSALKSEERKRKQLEKLKKELGVE